MFQALAVDQFETMSVRTLRACMLTNLHVVHPASLAHDLAEITRLRSSLIYVLPACRRSSHIAFIGAIQSVLVQIKPDENWPEAITVTCWTDLLSSISISGRPRTAQILEHVINESSPAAKRLVAGSSLTDQLELLGLIAFINIHHEQQRRQSGTTTSSKLKGASLPSGAAADNDDTMAQLEADLVSVLLNESLGQIDRLWTQAGSDTVLMAASSISRSSLPIVRWLADEQTQRPWCCGTRPPPSFPRWTSCRRRSWRRCGFTSPPATLISASSAFTWRP